MRLDKYLAQATGLSRKEVKKKIHQFSVSINGTPERDAGYQVKDQDQVKLEGDLVASPETRYLMFYKPLDCVCANDDPTHPTVFSWIDLPRANELHIAGRLDLDATGLVLLTDDGQWAHRVTSPKHKTHKVYHVCLAEHLAAEAEERFTQGFLLEGEVKRTKPARLQRITEQECRVTIYEGRYHQVKRMFAALGNRVTALHRESVGQIKLDAELEPGEYRSLTPQEIASVLSGAQHEPS
ncbi:16S rRNA pseudouridine(516) synthase RsuA [Nitrincola tapanii]|uniref:Pseudouridine synthase n=1 Tax=Nitrincola tapanii TaxID=1708751 RepID=A0A5A9W0C7_9GAMM|nr:16S rRNA pseudouridine(516) synthase RsuA [Nitrincola tapanii]KAA0873669.1 16S rRNA pseudouridine(516) synthase RsuA [Nitrincola tapanii]